MTRTRNTFKLVRIKERKCTSELLNMRRVASEAFCVHNKIVFEFTLHLVLCCLFSKILQQAFNYKDQDQTWGV